MELAAEKEAIARLIAEYKGSKEEAEENEDEEDLYIKEIRTKDEEDALKEAMEEGKEARFMARVKVPTQKDIEEALIRRKKQELLEMYAIDADDLDQLEKQAKETPAAADPPPENGKDKNGASEPMAVE